MYHWMSIHHFLDADRGKGSMHLPKACFPLLSQLHKGNATYFHFKGEKCEAKVMGTVLTNRSKYTKVTYTVTLLLGT